MKKIVCLLCICLSLSFTSVHAGFLDQFRAEKVASNTYVIHGPLGLPSPENEGFMNNPGFIVTGNGVVVIDPGSSVYTGQMVLREIKKITNQPVIAVFNTHVHGDHWLGNDGIKRAYPDAVIYAHKDMISAVKGGEGEDWIDLLHNMTKGATDGTRIVNAEIESGGGETLTLGGHHFTIQHYGKAHTFTDIMIHYQEDDVLFTGDNAGYKRILRVDRGSFKGNIETLKKARQLNPAVVVPGHGITGGTEILDTYLEYLMTLYTGVNKYFEQDMADFEMKPLISKALGKFHSWTGYEHELGKHVNGAYLEIEAAAF